MRIEAAPFGRFNFIFDEIGRGLICAVKDQKEFTMAHGILWF
jgi:hypothetical protein